MIGQAIVLTASQEQQFLSCANSYMLYDNLIYRQNTTITSSQEGSESAGVLALKDGNTDIKWISDNSPTVEIEVTLPQTAFINSMAVSGANLTQALVRWNFYTWDAIGSAWVLQKQGSGKKDNSPIFLVFDEVETAKVKFEFICNGELRIGELGCGKALRFPVSPGLGFQPSKWQNDNKVINTTTEGNSLANSTVLKRTVTENPKFNLLDPNWLDEKWVDVMEKATGLPVWFAWNQQKEPNNVIYGHLSTDVKPAYDSSLLSSLNLTIKGVK
jgi:hypothetical protein